MWFAGVGVVFLRFSVVWVWLFGGWLLQFYVISCPVQNLKDWYNIEFFKFSWSCQLGCWVLVFAL